MNRSVNSHTFSDPIGDGNSFEKGSRHPRWRGGVDNRTLKNRQVAYRKYGIGFNVSANSNTESLSDAPKRSPLVDFRAGRISEVSVKDIRTIQDVNRTITIILGYEGRLFDELKPQASRLVTIERIQYRVVLEVNNGVCKIDIKKTGSIAKPRHKITLLAQLRKEAKHRQKALALKQKQIKLRKHSNFIKGLDKLK